MISLYTSSLKTEFVLTIRKRGGNSKIPHRGRDVLVMTGKRMDLYLEWVKKSGKSKRNNICFLFWATENGHKFKNNTPGSLTRTPKLGEKIIFSFEFVEATSLRPSPSLSRKIKYIPTNKIIENIILRKYFKNIALTRKESSLMVTKLALLCKWFLIRINE